MKFLKHIDFKANNIALREITSACLAAYKNSQSFALGQMNFCSKHKFSKTAREILLLEYDIWFRYLLELEDSLRRKKDKETGIEVYEMAISYSEIATKDLLETINKHTESFDEKFVVLWNSVHLPLYEYFIKKISSIEAETLKEFMTELTSTLISIMRHSLYEMHEIDCVLENCDGDDSFFVSFDELCIDFYKVTQECLLTDRLFVYNKYANKNVSSIIIKDYSERRLLTTGSEILSNISVMLNENNIKISKIL